MKTQETHTYIAIDLKSFYASVECVERGLDPLATNLVVADASRTAKTICLSVSPALKSYGIPGRARLFEVIQKVKGVNAERQRSAPGGIFSGSSCSAPELKVSSNLSLDYIVAPPQMAHYMQVSTEVYKIYLKYVAPEDIHVYSIDEVFMDATNYLSTYGLTARELTMKMIHDVLDTTGITATAGIGTNMYLAKVAMDIEAKHIAPDEDGVRIAELDEMSYRRLLWSHRPLTDFWRVGTGYARKLEENGLRTMGDVARCSIGQPNSRYNEDLIYRLFGVNAELLIDHAWGWEPCTIAEIHAYKPGAHSLGSGQVLQHPYAFEKAELIVREMADLLALDLVDKGLVTDRIDLTVGYDVENLSNPEISRSYHGDVTTDRYGRRVPKYAHGTAKLDRQTSSAKLIRDAAAGLFDDIADTNLLVRRINIMADNVVNESSVTRAGVREQPDLFADVDALQRKCAEEESGLEREKRVQKTMLSIRKKFGKNAILKGMNLQEGATAIERNKQIGGHKA